MGKDPVKHCDLYKDDGCAHVDGYLCDFETCSMRLDYALRVHPEGGYEIGSVEESERVRNEKRNRRRIFGTRWPNNNKVATTTEKNPKR